MTVILMVTPEGVTWNRNDIADVCGCRSEYIREIEFKALQKLRQRSALKGYA